MERSKILELVNRSPAAVRKGNRDEWLAIFDSQAIVNDPVGTPLNQGENIRTFYDCFIKPNDITFDVKKDLIDVDALRLVRIADIHIQLNKSKFGVIQPAHIEYELDHKTLRIKRLNAIWQPNHAKPFGVTWKHFLISCLMMGYAFFPMVITFGPWFSFLYCVGVITGPISGGKTLMKRLKSCVALNDTEAFQRLFHRPNSSCVRQGSRFLRPKEAFEHFWKDTKSIEIKDTVKSAGWKTTMFYRRETAQGQIRNGFVDIDVRWKNMMSSVVETMYVYEEDE